MLKVRVVTGCILGALLLLGLFLLPPFWAVLAFGAGVHHRRVGVGGVRRVASARLRARLVYARPSRCVCTPLALDRIAAHLLVLLSARVRVVAARVSRG